MARKFKHSQKQIIDLVNSEVPEEYKWQEKSEQKRLLYVAMTRPKNELHVITNSDPRKGNIFKYFKEYLSQNDAQKYISDSFDLSQKFSEVITYNNETTTTRHNFVSCSWRTRLCIRKKRGYSNDLKTKLAINWGELIHQIMAGINSKKDIDKTLKNFNVLENHGTIVFKRIKSAIEIIISDPRLAHLFSNQFSNFVERDIVDTDGTIYRPDRVIIQANNVVTLIDYKTGKERKEHEIQIKKYESILLKMGYKKIYKFLIYLTSIKVKEI